MRNHLRLFAAAALTILPAIAFAQDDAHHPDDSATTPPPTATTPAPVPTPAGPADPSANMMQMMGQMMPMMQQMMQMMPMMQMMQMMQIMQGGGMPGGGMMGEMPTACMWDAAKAYMNAMRGMGPPMTAALQTADPDVAFVKAMIPHHQAAIDMARAALTYAKDDKVKAWANQIIQAQEAEIAEMQTWLKERGQ
jgi:uncharacterized protein (DUF305 family)